MKTSWRRKPTILIGFLISVLVLVACSVMQTKAVSTYTEAELESMTKRVTPAVGIAGPEPELPRVTINVTYVPPTGKTIAVPAGGDFQAAINEAQPGDVITLQAGATYTGNFTLPAKTGSGWIIIRTSAPDSSLPPLGTRINPNFASALPKILTPNPQPAIEARDSAHHYRLIGLEFSQAPGVNQSFSLIQLGDRQTTLAQLPHDIILDRLYIHGQPKTTLRRGITLNSATTAVIDSYISDCKEPDADTQAIGGWNGAGPFKIVNNYLEGAGENFILGGADPTIPNLVPSDIEFKRNHCFKPLSWRKGDPSYAGTPWAVKNLFELKNAQRVLVDGNTFENNWAMAQNGFAILFTVRNQDGASPWSVVQDVTFTNNIIQSAGSGFNMHGQDNNFRSQISSRFRISNNLLVDINGPKFDSGGIAFQLNGGPNDVIIEHNTILQSGSIIATGELNKGLIFRNNLLPHNEYGVKGDSRGTGIDTLNTYFPDAEFRKNVMVGGPSNLYPPDNFFPPTYDQVGFVNFTDKDYRLTTTSPYRNAASDGTDVGVNYNLLDAARAGVPTVANVSAASYIGTALAPGSIAVGFGTGLAATMQSSTTVPLPTSIAGTSVKVKDSAGVERLSPLFFISPNQVNYQVPIDTFVGTATITVFSGTNLIAIGTVPITNTAPGLFTADSTGRGLPTAFALRVTQDKLQFAEPVARFDATQNRFVAVPIDLSSQTDQVFLILYGTGIARRSSLSTVTAKVGGVDCQVTYAGEQGALVGLDQLNLLLSPSLAGRNSEVDVVLTVDGQTANAVRVAIR